MIKPITRKNEKVASQEAERKEAEIRNKEFFAQDEVEYEVHVENTGNIEITMDVTDHFTQNPEYFTVPVLKDVKFTGKGTWNNKGKDDKVANITLNVGEKATEGVGVSNLVVNEMKRAKEYARLADNKGDIMDEMISIMKWTLIRMYSRVWT